MFKQKDYIEHTKRDFLDSGSEMDEEQIIFKETLKKHIDSYENYSDSDSDSDKEYEKFSNNMKNLMLKIEKNKIKKEEEKLKRELNEKLKREEEEKLIRNLEKKHIQTLQKLQTQLEKEKLDKELYIKKNIQKKSNNNNTQQIQIELIDRINKEVNDRYDTNKQKNDIFNLFGFFNLCIGNRLNDT